MTALPIMLAALLWLAIGYRYYSAFLAARVCALDDARVTPAIRLNDGQNYHPTHKWVLFGHHFAAISGAGPLIGPVLAIQFGYMPGLLWLLIGVVLAGAVQDMLVLAASVRFEGRSLAEIARMAIGPRAGAVASVAILFIVVVALAGLGLVVVKALGGEEVGMAEGTQLKPPPGTTVMSVLEKDRVLLHFPPGTHVVYQNKTEVTRSTRFVVSVAATAMPSGIARPSKEPKQESFEQLTLGPDTSEMVAGSSWGTFTIACTVPIALLVGLYIYKIRRGRVVEASLLGGLAVLAATVAGNWIPGSVLEPYFSLSRGSTIIAICSYGFIAAVLPVWLLLCPRDYLSSFLKIGTVILLVVGVIIADPPMRAPMINPLFSGSKGGPYFSGAIFPFVFICIMCGAISGFHALVASGTTPKMISKESHIRTIGYGAMLIEGLVGVIALIAAASLPQGDYWAINIDLKNVSKYADSLKQLDASTDNLADIEQKVGGESLRGRTGGAVTLAVGMSNILTTAINWVSRGAVNVDAMVKYWYHFAIMFEALFILTTIDTGTRIARFMLHEVLGKFNPKLERVDWLPGALLCTGLVTVAWGGLIWSGSIDTIWPMFGIANQLLAAIALCIVTVVLVAEGKARYAPITLLPLAFVTTTTVSAAVQMIGGRFGEILQTGIRLRNWPMAIKGGLNIGITVMLLGCFVWIVAESISRCHRYLKQGT
ncbi:MAG: carbon starvation protein A [Planctomycetia bacterium]|nr:carbon starvation protein A [Planctomycetia bacterium]